MTINLTSYIFDHSKITPRCPKIQINIWKVSKHSRHIGPHYHFIVGKWTNAFRKLFTRFNQPTT